MSVKCAFFGIFQKLAVFCCAIFFGFANAFSANLPSGYTELEYIQSDGASYLIVPYRVNNKTVFYARYNETQKGTSVASCIFGVTDAPDASKANYGILRLLDGASTFNRMGWGDSTPGSIINVNAPQNLDTWYEVLYDQNKLYQNGRFYTTSATQPNTSWTANYDLGIFARNGSSVTMPAITKISSVWAKENGEYKINLVPAKRNSDNVLGMYDVVSGEFFTNQGTGEFTAGPVVPENPIKIATTAYNSARFNPVVTDLNTTIATIRDVVTNTINQTAAIADLQAKKQTRPDEQCPAGKKCLLVEDNNGVPHWYEIIENIYGLPTGYTALEYIESTGTQYINTGVDINSGNFSIDTDMQFTALTSPQYYGIYGGGYFGITDSYFAIGGHGTSVTANKTKHNFVLSSSIGDNKVLTLSIDGTNYTYTRNVIAGRIALLTVLNGSTTMGLMRAKMYSVKIYQNNTLVRNMVPAKNSSGVIGMYDLVNNVFYTNSGTGTFTAGPEI